MATTVRASLFLIVLCAILGVNAQFGGFFQGNQGGFPFGHNPFGGGQQQQQQQQQPPGRSQKGWQEMESGE